MKVRVPVAGQWSDVNALMCPLHFEQCHDLVGTFPGTRADGIEYVSKTSKACNYV